jgi:hypothetical protein
MKRRSFNSCSLPPPPPLPSKAKKPPATGSLELSAGPPWMPETKPRFHEDPLLAIQALLSVLDIDK